MTEMKRQVKIDLFPGNLQEYNSLKGEEHAIMDTGTYVKFVSYAVSGTDYDFDLIKLVDDGCVGLIHYGTVVKDWIMPSGVPVKKKI